MGEKIAYLGVDKRVSTETILRAAAAARDALGEETPTDFFVWIQRAEAAKRVRWFGLHAKLKCTLFAPSDNLADCVAEVLDHLVILRRYGTVCTEQLEYYARPPGKTHLGCQLSVVSQGGNVGTVCGKITVPRRAVNEDGDEDDRDAIVLGLEQYFPGEGEQYWNAWDEAEFFVIARGGTECAPTPVYETALREGRIFVAHF